jgi:hypothetical protein
LYPCDGSTEAPVPPKEKPDAGITSNEQGIMDISKDRNNDVNITTRKNEDPYGSPVEPSEPSGPSANLNDESKSVEGTSKDVNDTNGILHNPHEADDQNTNNDISKEIDNNATNPILPAYVYRLGYSDRFACKYCNIRDDKWGMIKHYHPEEEGEKQ